jgi:iron-regulated transporter 1
MEQNDDDNDDNGETAKQQLARHALPPLPSEQHFEIPSSLWRLYVSHGLTAWSLRMWEFAAALLLMYVKPNSLALPSALQLTIGLTSALGSTSMGTLVDRLPRLAAARRSLLFNKLSFAAAAICVYIVLIHWGVASRDVLDTAGGANAGTATTVAAATTAVGDDGRPEETASFWLLVVGMMLLTAVGHLAYAANRLSVEKDWVLTLLQDDMAHIARANAVLRRIDLSCKLLAPMAAGFVMTFAGPKTGALTIALWNLISTLPELHLLQRMYSNFPALHQSRAQDGDDALTSAQPKGLCARMAEPATVLYQGWRTYAAQITLRPGLALALLYGSMLGMGPVMTAYAYSRGMTEATLGGLRGVGAVFGITATFIFAPLQGRVGLARTGLFAIWAQLATLVLCLVSAALAQPWFGDCHSLREDSEAFHACHRSRALELGLLMSGTILARMGLWLFDLTVSQLLQQW